MFSYLFHGVLTLFLMGISVVALLSGEPLHLKMLPWQGATLSYVLLFGALAGLLSVILAIRGKWRILFFLWSLAVLLFTFQGFFFSQYHFRGAAAFHHALYLTAGALIAALGAWVQLGRKTAR